LRYSAFISYNHKDEAHARWLHRALETYRLPRHLRDRPGRDGEAVGQRLKPVFRDRDEVTPAADLGQVVRDALEASAALIVICSPHGARSKWVNAEIRQFAALGRRDRIFCIIVDGEPMSADPALECFPAALFDDGAPEPLCADIRPQRDTRDDARLKLVASVLGLGYDELRRRDHARRLRRLTAIAAGASAGVLVTGALAVTAYIARNEAVAQRDIARERSITAERTVAFVKGMFAVSDPSEARGSSVTAREILDRGVASYHEALREEPVARAEIGLTLAEVYASLGLYRESERLVNANTDLPADARTVRARQEMLRAESLFRLGEYEAAEARFGESVAMARADDIARETLLSRTLVGLGQVRSALDDFKGAESALTEAIAIEESRGRAGQRDLAFALEALAQNAFQSGEYDRAVPLLERANNLRLSQEGANSPSVSDNLGTLASIAYMQGRGAEAEALFRSRLAIDEKVLGPEHPDVATTLNNIGRILVERRAFAEAEPLLDRAVKNAMRERGAEHDDMAFMLSNLALARRGLGRTDEAEALLRQAGAVAEARGHRTLAPTWVELASIACGSKRIEEGESLLSRAREQMQADYPDDTWRMAWIDVVNAQCLRDAGDRQQASALLARSAGAVLARWDADTLFGAQVTELQQDLGAGTPGH
jgi:tetratricopeptide (TPR) repeat protein